MIHFKKGLTYYDNPGSMFGFNITKLIKDIIFEQNIAVDNEGAICCFKTKNLFIKKGLLGTGKFNLKYKILFILESFGFSINFTDCCSDKYNIPGILFSNFGKLDYKISLKKEIQKVLDALEVVYTDPCCASDEPELTPMSLVNEEGDDDLAYPLAVLDINNLYLGIANDETEYITIWNAGIANQAVGTIASGVGTDFQVELVDPLGPPFALYGLEFYSITSNNANAVLHVNDNDIVVYGATAVRGSTGVISLSSAIDIYNGSFGVQVEPVINVRRVTTVTSALDTIRVLHSRISTRVGMNTLTDCRTLTGLLPKACETFAFRVTQSTDLVSGVVNWAELQSIQFFTVEGLGGGVYNITNAAFIPQPPPSTIGIALRDIGPSPVLDLADFTWFTDANLPNLRRILVSSNLGDLIGDSVSWFLTMPKVDKQLTITNNNSLPDHTSAVNSDLVINRIAAALVGITPVSPAIIRLEDTTNRTAASTAASTALTTAGWTVTYA